MKHFKKIETENPFWISISDLMSGLTMIFVLIMAYAFLSISSVNENQLKVISLLKAEFEVANLAVDVDSKTGAIVIKDKILFDTNESDIKSEGYDFLDRFCPIMAKVIFEHKEAEREIIAIDIEGFSSEKGYKEVEMMDLSLRRSQSVWEYIYEMDNFAHKKKFISILKVSGLGNIKATSHKDIPEDRKVVFQLQFRNLIDAIIDIMSLEKSEVKN